MPLQAREESSAYMQMTMSKKTNLQQRQIRKWAVMTNRNNAWGKKIIKKIPSSHHTKQLLSIIVFICIQAVPTELIEMFRKCQ